MLSTPLNRDEDLRTFRRAHERKDAGSHLLTELFRGLLQGLIIFNIKHRNEDRECALLGRLGRKRR